MRKRVKTKLQDAVEDIFGCVEEYAENKDSIYFVVSNLDFTAEKLFGLANLLGTGRCNLESSTRNSGYCETCDFEYGVMEVTLYEVDRSKWND